MKEREPCRLVCERCGKRDPSHSFFHSFFFSFLEKEREREREREREGDAIRAVVHCNGSGTWDESAWGLYEFTLV